MMRWLVAGTKHRWRNARDHILLTITAHLSPAPCRHSTANDLNSRAYLLAQEDEDIAALYQPRDYDHWTDDEEELLLEDCSVHVYIGGRHNGKPKLAHIAGLDNWAHRSVSEAMLVFFFLRHRCWRGKRGCSTTGAHSCLAGGLDIPLTILSIPPTPYRTEVSIRHKWDELKPQKN